MRVDPVAGSTANPQTFNRYPYAGNNPTNRVDPLGLDWECVCGHLPDEDSMRGGGGMGPLGELDCDCIWVDEGHGGGQNSGNPCNLALVNEILDGLGKDMKSLEKNAQGLVRLLQGLALDLSNTNSDLATRIRADSMAIGDLIGAIDSGGDLPDKRDVKRLGQTILGDLASIGPTLPMDKLGRDLASIFNNISNTNHFLGDFNRIDAEALKKIGACTNLGADQRQKYNQLNSEFRRLQRSLGVLYGALAPSA